MVTTELTAEALSQPSNNLGRRLVKEARPDLTTRSHSTQASWLRGNPELEDCSRVLTTSNGQLTMALIAALNLHPGGKKRVRFLTENYVMVVNPYAVV